MQSLSDILQKRIFTPDHHNSKEFQAYGNMLAEELGDTKHRALYIKIAKTENRNLVEMAREFVKASPKALTRGRLFMWKLSQLKQAKK
jgi:hypothetical protein